MTTDKYMGNSEENRYKLIIRSFTGLVFVSVVLTALLSGRLEFSFVYGVFLVLVMYEYLVMTVGKGHNALKYIAIAAGLSFFVFSVYAGTSDIAGYIALGTAALSLIALPVIALFSKNGEGLAYAWASLLYAALPFCLMGAAMPASTALLSVFVLLWAGDVGAYCIGTLLGQGPRGHKLMPSVSPKKSWEGVAGGALTAFVAGWILYSKGLMFDHMEVPVYAAMIYVPVIFAAGVVGDLVESQLKRRFGVKDSGTMLPGHGGYLDRFDSALLAIPVASVIYKIILICC